MDKKSIEIRRDIIEILRESRRGHLTSAFSIVEILRVLYDNVLRYDVNNVNNLNRDRFILSKGHGCLALYVLLANIGIIPKETLRTFCQTDSLLGGHPEHKIPGIEASTGSLGHGMSIGVGMALSAKHDERNSRIYVLVGDGECNEGTTWEAAMCAAKHNLDNYTVIVDYNKQQSYGSVKEIMDLEPFADKWRSFGFLVKSVDGHSIEELTKTFTELPCNVKKPNAILCHTVKGKGIKFIENNLSWHHKSNISDDDIRSLLNALEVG